MVFFLVVFNAGNYCGRPFNNKVFQAVALVQISVHELLHCFTREPVVFAFLIELRFLLVDIVD